MTVKVKSTKPVPQPVQRAYVPRKEGFIIRCIKIVIDDMRHKIYGTTSKERENWERYDRFERLAKGER